ncbi:Ero1-like protein [Armadillidium vulgare]|nr:Ero1-like protein [Armadillidium vulgare]
MCLEKRNFTVLFQAFIQVLTSIFVHDIYFQFFLIMDKNTFMIKVCVKKFAFERDIFENNPEGVWGFNLEEFQRRFDPELTNDAGPNRLKNLYFLYLVELKAIAKLGPYLKTISFYTGNDEKDHELKFAISDLVSVVDSFPNHFDEGLLFLQNSQGPNLKTEFRDHFRNISLFSP